MKNEFLLADRETAEDLQAFLLRAKRMDADGLVRLRAYGKILAAYVAPIFAGSLMDSGPTVIGLRTCELANDTEVEGLVPIGQGWQCALNVFIIVILQKPMRIADQINRAPLCGGGSPVMRGGWPVFGGGH